MKRLPILAVFLACLACRGEGISEYRVPKESLDPVRGILAGSSLGEHAAHGGAEPASASSTLLWDEPAGWTRVPAGGIRLASYRVSGPDGEADVSIVRLPGEAGGTLPNIERWRGQLGLSPFGGEKALFAAAQRVPSKAGEAVFVDMTGLPEGGASTRMLGAVLPRRGETWFFKLTGPEKTVGAARDAFHGLLSGLRPRG